MNSSALLDILMAADDQRNALMNGGRARYPDPLHACAGESPGLFDEKSERRGFIHQPEFALRFAVSPGIQIDAAAG